MIHLAPTVRCDLIEPVVNSKFRHRFRLVAALTAPLLAFSVLSGTGSADAAPPLPAEFNTSQYAAVDTNRFRSLAYEDNGHHYFSNGRWQCRIGNYGYVGCQGKPATAPPGTRGTAISGDQQGPWWVKPGTTYRFTARSNFGAPALGVGNRITVNGVTCTAPTADRIACTTGARGFILSPGWHKFYYPAGDTAHSKNPAPRYLPERLRGSDQLPASGAPLPSYSNPHW